MGAFLFDYMFCKPKCVVSKPQKRLAGNRINSVKINRIWIQSTKAFVLRFSFRLRD